MKRRREDITIAREAVAAEEKEFCKDMLKLPLMDRLDVLEMPYSIYIEDTNCLIIEIQGLGDTNYGDSFADYRSHGDYVFTTDQAVVNAYRDSGHYLNVTKGWSRKLSRKYRGYVGVRERHKIVEFAWFVDAELLLEDIKKRHPHAHITHETAFYKTSKVIKW